MIFAWLWGLGSGYLDRRSPKNLEIKRHYPAVEVVDMDGIA